jgi:hypothetical protein
LTKKPGRGSLAGVVLYYALAAVGIWAAVRWIPGFAGLGSGLGLDDPTAVTQQLIDELEGQTAARPVDTGLLSATVSMLGALFIVIPVAWVYVITKRRQGYDPSVVQTMIILPVAVSGIVMIVQSSIALAFSLAGIVAAVRFRNTLKDTKDAVYVFLAIGVGLAAGVQAFEVAIVMSIVFNLVVLALWRFNIGHIYDVQIDALPADAALPEDPGGMPFQGKIVIQCQDADAAAPMVESVLTSSVKRWERGVIEGSDSALEYHVRFKKKIPPKDVITTLHQRGIDLDLTAEFVAFAE